MAASSLPAEDVLEERDARALTRCMAVLDDVGRARGASGLYLVVSDSGREYLVDADSQACECDDSFYRNPSGGCIHARRVAFATGARELPEWVQENRVDDRLGDHIETVEGA